MDCATNLGCACEASCSSGRHDCNVACPYPSVTFYWTNVKSSQADVYIKTDAGSTSYSGKIVFEIRKHVTVGTDPHCTLNGTCDSNDHRYDAINPIGSGTKEYKTTFRPKQEGDYHFDVWYYEGDTEKHWYGRTQGEVHLVPCESSAYTSCGSAYNFGSSGGSKSNMCGSEQYYYVSAPTGKKCKIKWSVTPDSGSDYDLYVNWSSTCPSTSSYDCKSTNSGSSSESCTSGSEILSSYALVKKVDGSGTYNISASVSDCVDAGCLACGSPTSNNCWRKMKGESCNDLNWYDFHDYGVLGASPKCAVGASQALHYDILADEPPYAWCPETEAMWKEIKCGGGWPSGSEGDLCKVWWLDITGWHSRQGYWDPDLDASGRAACVIKCTSDRRESTESDARDYCTGSGPGDGKCEQACGADAACDEYFPGTYLDTNGDTYGDLYCDFSCLANPCNSNNECKKVSGNYQYCIYVNTGSGGYWTWSNPSLFQEDGNPWQECFDGYDNDCDGAKDCADTYCKGVKNPNTNVVCCQSDDDCKDANGKDRYDPVSHTKIVCDSPSGSYEPKENTYTCQPLRSCSKAEDCEDTWCCVTPNIDSNSANQGKCWQRGIYTNNPKYLCDPPEGFDLAKKQLTLLDFLLKFNPFSRGFS